jgi:RNA polymerase-binding transcription factor DksA
MANKSASKKLTPQEVKQFEDALRQMLGVLTGDIRRLENETIGDEAKSDVSAEDSGAVIHSMEISLELLERDENAVTEVMAALRRIEQGVFGLCTMCEKRLRRSRLQAMPHAKNCIDCQRTLERPG